MALGASGKITGKLQVFANYTYLKSKVLQGASDFVSRGGVTGTEADFIKGDPLVQVPDHSFSVLATYDFTDRFQLGYGVTYQGETYLTQHFGVQVAPATTPVSYVGRSTIPLVKSPDYSVHRLFAAWRATDRLEVRANVNNLFDEHYLTRVRTAGDVAWATPGDARSAVLTATYKF